MKKRLLLIPLALLLVISLIAIGCPTPPAEEEEGPPVEEEEGPPPPPPPAKDTINICAARSVSGPLAIIESTAFGPVLDYWVATVNAEGGIYVEEYGKKLTINLNKVDDTSDMGTMTSLLSDMIKDPDCDFVFPPVSTAFLQAAASIVHEPGYEHVLMGAEGGCTSIAAALVDYPYLFAMLNFSNWNQMNELFKILDSFWADYHEGTDNPIMDFYVIFIDDLHGWEYKSEFGAEMVEHNAPVTKYNIIDEVAITPFATDVSAQLGAAELADADVFCSFTYPPTTGSTVGQAIELDINFNAIVCGPGAYGEYFYDPAFGGFGELVDGVISFGAWNEYSPQPGLADFAAGMIDMIGRGLMDWWGGAYYIAGLECFQKAIEEAGTLDQAVIREVLATSKFDTALGETWFSTYASIWPTGDNGGLLAVECHPGEIGQWLYNRHGDGKWILEVIDIGPNNTATGVYPKPEWP